MLSKFMTGQTGNYTVRDIPIPQTNALLVAIYDFFDLLLEQRKCHLLANPRLYGVQNTHCDSYKYIG
jgi:hypothetical protein